MILGSKTEDSKKIYYIEMTEKEFNRATQEGIVLKRPVEWSQGRGEWSLGFKKFKKKT